MDEKELEKITKKELASRLEIAEERIKELEETLASRDAMLAGTDEPGWLITCKNKAYTGITAGVKFSSGRAFIPDRGKDSEMLVKLLVGNFGYKEERSTAKAAKESEPEPVESKQSFIDKIATTQMVGG